MKDIQKYFRNRRYLILQARDFDGKWYRAKIKEVDWIEEEILVGFKDDSIKYFKYEWIPMDSSRLRTLLRSSAEENFGMPLHVQKQEKNLAKQDNTKTIIPVAEFGKEELKVKTKQ